MKTERATDTAECGRECKRARIEEDHAAAYARFLVRHWVDPGLALRHALMVEAEGDAWLPRELWRAVFASLVVPLAVPTRLSLGEEHALVIGASGRLFRSGASGRYMAARELTRRDLANRAQLASELVFLPDGARCRRATAAQYMAGRVLAVASTQWAAFALTDDARLWQLGAVEDLSGRGPDRFTAVLGGVVAIGACDDAAVALCSDGCLWMSVRHDDGTAFKARLSEVCDFACGPRFAIARRRDGTIWALNFWGLVTPVCVVPPPARCNPGASEPVLLDRVEYRRLQYGATRALERIAPRDTLPVLVRHGQFRERAVYGGDERWAFLDASGALEMSGIDNDNGALGCGDDAVPQARVRVFDDACDVACQRDATLVLRRDGSLWAAGLNSWGRLGLAPGDHPRVFTRVPVELK